MITILKCSGCDKNFEIKTSRYNYYLKIGRVKFYCSRTCFYKHKTKSSHQPKQLVNCDFCKIQYYKFACNINITDHNFCTNYCRSQHDTNTRRVEYIQLKCPYCLLTFELRPSCVTSREKNNNKIFCSKRCCILFYSPKNKEGCSKRSKIELYIEEKIRKEFFELKCNFNDRKICNGLELDIYFPTLNLAIELNGIFHYEMIFSEEHFNQIQGHDNIKIQICKDYNIKLFILDISFTCKEKNFENHWKTIKSEIFLREKELELINSEIFQLE